MLVHGGTPRGLRVFGFAAALGVLGSLVTACGSRTSMLDPDAYATSEDGSAGNAGSASLPGSGSAGKSGGTGILGRAGSSSTTPAGGPATGGPATGVDTTLASTPCQQYCPGYASQCKARLEGPNCLATCQGELNGFGPSCQTLGISALSCLTPFFSVNGGDCNAAVNNALAQCGMIVSAFDSCKKAFSGQPTTSKPTNNFNACKRSGDGDPMTCKETFFCSDGNYTTFCSGPTGSMLRDCGCVGPSGQLLEGSLPSVGDLCLSATALCQ